VPAYTLKGKNVVILGVFKESCVLSFLKGGLLEDPYQILERPGPNSQEGRFIRFTQLSQAQEIEGKIKEYLHQAIEVERSGKKAIPKPANLVLPEELLQKFASQVELFKDAGAAGALLLPQISAAASAFAKVTCEKVALQLKREFFWLWFILLARIAICDPSR
jgi:hypothetical protein